MRALAKASGYAAGYLAIGIAALAAAPVVVLWLAAALLLDIAEGGLLA